MEYQIHKTSDYGGNEKPCKNAIKTQVPDYDQRSCTEEYYNSTPHLCKHGKWRDKGWNHEVVGSGIRRQTGVKNVWIVNINTIQELINLTKEVGRVIFDGDDIEIYDDYRE